jgi:hypothetical protein
MVEPLDGIRVLRLRAEELGSALEGYLEGCLQVILTMMINNIMIGVQILS